MSKQIVRKVFSKPFFYRYLRGLIFFGTRTKPIEKALALKSGDTVLDVGCGTGEFSTVVHSDQYRYLGVDMNEDYIVEATKSYGNAYRQFKVLDILKMRFKEKEFEKSLYSGVMHHLSDEENLKVLAEMSRITRDRVVIVDSNPAGHFINNFLWKNDRGSFIRKIEDQCALVKKVMEITEVSQFYVRSGVQQHSLIVCKPASL
jgi:ubiquinone/menaquinone biosynthesis C-methylase UbiE